MNLIKPIKDHWINFLDIIYPRTCVVCKQSLHSSEAHICLECELLLPVINKSGQEIQDFESRFWGRVPFGSCLVFLRYDKSESVKSILKEIKYNKNRELAEYLGQKMGAYCESNFLLNFDVVIPIPLHPLKEKIRGFNQSAAIAHGFSESTGIPTDIYSVVRNKNTKTQTKMNREERWENVKSIFMVKDLAAIQNRNILILDDVVTTGSTLESLAESLIEAGAKKISFAVLAIAI